MKKGDKLICIKTYPTLYLKGEAYYIENIEESIIFIESSEVSQYPGIYGFHNVDKSNNLSFNNYFVNIQEERKLKLVKINKINKL
jgi:hypothetical protein